MMSRQGLSDSFTNSGLKRKRDMQISKGFIKGTQINCIVCVIKTKEATQLLRANVMSFKSAHNHYSITLARS